jgi:photosynthetic reaction center H subunit
MYNPEFFGIFDVTSLVLTAFVMFFIGLIFYLRREDRREGYPLEDDVTGRLEGKGGLLFAATPKTFLMGHGSGTTKPNDVRDTRELAAIRTAKSPGSPLEPTGDPMQAGVGPGAYAQRSRAPDPMLHGGPKIVPLRAAPGYFIPKGEADPRGMTVLGADRLPAGVVSDVWVDKAEYLIRYLEVELGLLQGGLSVVGATSGGRKVLLPMTMAVVNKGKGVVKVDAVLASQFAGAPALASPDQVTVDEEERVCAYYGGGYLYATPMRSEPLL